MFESAMHGDSNVPALEISTAYFKVQMNTKSKNVMVWSHCCNTILFHRFWGVHYAVSIAPEEMKMKPVKELELGFADAENYKRRENKDLLNRVFIRDAHLDDLCEPNVSFLIGEKGTGKTAYSQLQKHVC